MTAKGSLKLPGVKLKLGDKKARWKSLVGICILVHPLICLISYSQLMNVALPGLLTLLICVFLVVFLLVPNKIPTGLNSRTSTLSSTTLDAAVHTIFSV